MADFYVKFGTDNPRFTEQQSVILQETAMKIGFSWGTSRTTKGTIKGLTEIGFHTRTKILDPSNYTADSNHYFTPELTFMEALKYLSIMESNREFRAGQRIRFKKLPENPAKMIASPSLSSFSAEAYKKYVELNFVDTYILQSYYTLDLKKVVDSEKDVATIIRTNRPLINNGITWEIEVVNSSMMVNGVEFTIKDKGIKVFGVHIQEETLIAVSEAVLSCNYINRIQFLTCNGTEYVMTRKEINDVFEAYSKFNGVKKE